MYHTWCTKRRRLQPAHCVWPRGDTPRPRPGTVAGGATLHRRSGAAASNAEETEAEWFYEDLQDLLELTPKKNVLFIIGDWNAKVGSQEIPGVMGKFGLGVQNEVGQRLIDFCQENALVIANILFQQHKRSHPHLLLKSSHGL